MKVRYMVAIAVLFVLAAALGFTVACTRLGDHPRLEKAIQASGILVALLAAVVALSAADPKTRKASIETKLSLETEVESFRADMSEDLREAYRQSPDPVKSYRVQFHMTNVSGFTLHKPTLTFRLPIDRQHPHKRGTDTKWSVRTFNSNIYNSRAELTVLEFGDARILSNSNLPYWNDEAEITLWIRMVLDKDKVKPFNVELSVNCENAGGTTYKVPIVPKALLDTFTKGSSSSGPVGASDDT